MESVGGTTLRTCSTFSKKAEYSKLLFGAYAHTRVFHPENQNFIKATGENANFEGLNLETGY